MSLFGILEGVKCDIASKVAEKKMISAEEKMYKDVTVGDVKKVVAAADYQKKTGCNWNFAIQKFFCSSKLTTGHYAALIKLLSGAGVTDKQQLYANMAATIALGAEGKETDELRKAQYTDSEILEFKDWLGANKESAAQMQMIFDGEAGEYPGEEWVPESPAVAQARVAATPVPSQVPVNPAVGMNFVAFNPAV